VSGGPVVQLGVDQSGHIGTQLSFFVPYDWGPSPQVHGLSTSIALKAKGWTSRWKSFDVAELAARVVHLPGANLDEWCRLEK
jgi:hypothetical protein